VFKRLFWTTQSLFLLAFVCWILDRVACEEITGFGLEHFGFYPQLHALWHVFIGLTFWLIVAMFLAMQAWKEQGIDMVLKKGTYFVVDVPEHLA
jgi:hypothetical protein